MKIKIIILVITTTIILGLIPISSSSETGTAPELEALIPLDKLPRKLVVGVENGTATLYEDKDVKYAIVYMNPPSTSLVIYELSSNDESGSFFKYLSKDVLGQKDNETKFHDKPAYIVQSESSIHHFWVDGKRVYAVEVVRTTSLTETDIKAASIMAELLFEKSQTESRGAGIWSSAFVITAIIAAFLLHRRK